MAEGELSFKEMCVTFEVTPRTLRHYEYIELLSPRREGRSRLYSPRDVVRMKLIMRGRSFGFALEEIRQWLLIYEREGKAAQLRSLVQRADKKLIELEEERHRLGMAIADLKELKDAAVRDLKGS